MPATLVVIIFSKMKVWLFGNAGLCVAMISIGGLTRLTESGNFYVFFCVFPLFAVLPFGFCLTSS
jgi:hypothetical protein